MSIFDRIREKGINLRHNRYGEHTTTCPACSHTRKPHNRSKPCLSIRVEAEKALYTCHHCHEFHGAIFASDTPPPKPSGGGWKPKSEAKRRRWW